jgi:hypothetical protein
MTKFFRVSATVLILVVSTGIAASPVSDSRPANTRSRVVRERGDAPSLGRLLAKLAKHFGWVQPQETLPIPPRP